MPEPDDPSLLGSALPVPASLVADPATHTMLTTLLPYVDQKIHQAIRSAPAGTPVVVRGLYVRPPQAEPADSENRRSPFNWHRPTVTRAGSAIVLNCFPSAAYVQHYAGVVATYLRLTGRDPAAVRHIPPPGAPRLLGVPFAVSNLQDMGQVDVVVVGYVFRLAGRLVTADGWEGRAAEAEAEAPDDENPHRRLFAWQRRTLLPSGKVVGFLECAASLWGDASGALVRCLRALCGAEGVIYVGKAGSLRPADRPNEMLVTASRSYCLGLGSEELVVSWENVLGPAARELGVPEGDVVTVVSPLCESAAWLAEWQPRCDWVDCEVGHMAAAAREQDMGFGCLLLISDNVARCGEETLANEDADDIQARRDVLFRRAEDVLIRFFAEYR